MEAGAAFGCPEGTHLIVLGVRDKRELLEAYQALQMRGIDSQLFYEPDEDMGETALCTAPLSSGRNFFRRYSLWRPLGE
jgi:hypothetical protein